MKDLKSPLFDGIAPQDMDSMLGCIGYHIRTYQKGEIISLEEENIEHVGVVLEGAVDMIKEDLWGNRTMLVRAYPEDVFGETFACGAESLSVVSFQAAQNTKVLFLSFCRVMHTCTHACIFHQTLIENMVRLIARKNRELMRKVEVVSKKNLREKILAYLSMQAQKQDSRYITLPLGRIELANYIGANRSALTRELAAMREDGLIDYDKNTFRILE